VCRQDKSLRAKAYTHYDRPSETEMCRIVVEEGHEIEVAKSGTVRKAARRTVFVYVHPVGIVRQTRAQVKHILSRRNSTFTVVLLFDSF
jgi:hypothetical protein